jgi:hypothetical protein
MKRGCTGDAAGMNPELPPICEKLRDLLDGPDAFDARFAIGSLVSVVKGDPGTYGAGAVAQLAALLGQDPSRLYRYASVTERWTEAEARHLVTTPRRRGRPLTWSHLVTLASIDGQRDRLFWTKATCAESLSVRALASRLARRELAGGGGRHLERAIRVVERFLAAHEREHVPPADAICCRETLARAVAAHERLRALAGRRVEALRRRLTALDEGSHAPGHRRASRPPLATLQIGAFRHD